nr:E3 ubiquitin-protein ligase ZNRF1 [Anolis sagrei ordinatus]
MGGKQSSAAAAAAATGGGGGGPGGRAMGLRSRSVSSVSAAAASAAGEASSTASSSSSSAPGPTPQPHPSSSASGAGPAPFSHGNGFQETTGGGGAPAPRDGVLYLGARASSALADALPIHLGPRWFGASHGGFKCPICSKSVASDEMEMHFIMCLSKPRLSYNDDVLTKDAGECVICLEELLQGDTIARLPCLCIYHKSCIDSWFEVNRSCPEHPSD